MPRNLSAELKLRGVKEYLDGNGNLYFIVEKYGVNRGFQYTNRTFHATSNLQE